MRATVNITAQAEAVSCSAKTIGTELECQFTGSSIVPFFTQPEKIEVVVKCNGTAVTSKITFIDIDLSVNQVGICTLNSPDVSNFKVNDVIEVEFTITGYGQVKVFYGYIDRIEKNHLNQGQIICADVLRDLRDGVLTQIISEFIPEARSNYIGAVFSTQPILPFLLSDYSINTTIKDTHRELSFGNANKLSVLQKLAEEYNLVFWVNYQNNKVVFKTVNSAETFLLPLEHSFTITDRSKANTGVKVIYEYHDEKIPTIETTIYLDESKKTINIDAKRKTIITTISTIGFFDIGSVGGYGTISETKETVTGDDDLRIISRIVANYGWATKGILEGFLELSAVIETWDWDSKYHITRKYEWTENDTATFYSAVQIQIDKTGEEEFISIPTSDIKTDEKTVVVGSEENPIYVYTSYISYEDEAKALADWLAQTELQGKEMNISIFKIIPTLKPGNYVTSNDFDGSCFIETVNYQYDLKNRNCSTSISGVLLNV